MEDPNYDEINIFMRELALRTAKLTAANKKLLVFFYFAGHGIQDNTVSIVLNVAEGKHVYKIENMLRALSKCDSAYVVGLLDCCREQPKSRGGPGHAGEIEDGENIILAFGCPPSRYTPAESTLAKDFFKFLEDSADMNGYIALPGNLNFFHTEDRKNETLIKVSKPALLRLSDAQQKTADGSGESSEKVRHELANMIHELDDFQSFQMLNQVKRLLKKTAKKRLKEQNSNDINERDDIIDLLDEKIN